MGSATAMSYMLALFLAIISVINFLALRERRQDMSRRHREKPRHGQPRAPARRRRAYRQDRNGPFFWIGIMVLLPLIFVVPLLWMFLTSFQTVEDSRRIPHHPHPGRAHAAGLQVALRRRAEPGVPVGR